MTALIEQVAAADAQALIRCKDGRKLPPIQRLDDHSWLARMGSVTVRVIDATIAVHLGNGTTRRGRYRLVTTLTDEKRYPADELVALYHQRWEIETSYLELKSTLGGGRMLRATTPAGIAQEVYALLITYQALWTAIADTALARPGTSPDRLSFTIALQAARDQVIHAAAAITANAAAAPAGDLHHSTPKTTRAATSLNEASIAPSNGSASPPGMTNTISTTAVEPSSTRSSSGSNGYATRPSPTGSPCPPTR